MTRQKYHQADNDDHTMTVEEQGVNDKNNNDDDDDENLPFSIFPKQRHPGPSWFASTMDYFPFGLELDYYYQVKNRNPSTTMKRTVTARDAAFSPAIKLKSKGGGGVNE